VGNKLLLKYFEEAVECSAATTFQLLLR
jgi:hypothetical protein